MEQQQTANVMNYEKLYKHLLERRRAYGRRYYEKNKEKIYESTRTYAKKHYTEYSQTEKYKEMKKRLNYKYYHGQDEETKRAANRKYYLAKKAKKEQMELQQKQMHQAEGHEET